MSLAAAISPAHVVGDENYHVERPRGGGRRDGDGKRDDRGEEDRDDFHIKLVWGGGVGVALGNDLRDG